MTNKKLLDRLHELNYEAHLWFRHYRDTWGGNENTYGGIATSLFGECSAKTAINIIENNIIPFLKIRGEK